MEIRPKTPVKKILIVTLVIILGGLSAYIYWNRARDAARPTQETAEKGKAGMSAGSAVQVPPEVKRQDAGQASGTDACRENREKLQGLFTYLDRQEYIASRQLKGGSSEYFKDLMARLLATPPFVMRETDSLMQVIRNRAHFFRTLGKKDTLLLREVLLKEGELLESSLAVFYQAVTLQDTCRADGSVMRVPLKEVYPYAVFFLNTLGGTAYLMRRDSRARMLIQYYCILILDQANRHGLNSLGLDIRPAIDLLTQDLKGAANLVRKEEYIETLKKIRTR